MFKKLLLAIAVTMSMPTAATAQQGNWKVHPFFVGSKVQNNIDTGSKVYYLVSNNLYCYNKATGVVESINNSNKLSDITVTNMYYNNVKKYVLLTYDNSNIDIITSDGRVVNIPEIKDAVITQTKAIAHVTFDDAHAYLATDFGFVVIDDSKFVVKESHIYGEPITTVAHVGDKLVVGHQSGVKYCDYNANRDKASAFRSSSIWLIDCNVYPIDDTHFFINSKASFDLCTVNGTTFTRTVITPNRAVSVQRTPTGFVANFPAINNYLTTDATGGNATMHSCSGEMVTSDPDGDGTMWAVNASGLHKLGDATQHKPNSIGISTTAYWAKYNPGDGKMYVSSTTDNAVLSSANKGAITEIWTYDGNTWENVTPANFPLYENGKADYQGNYQLQFLPGTTNSYVVTSRAAGVAKIVDKVCTDNYYWLSKDNRTYPLNDKYKPASVLDNEGNLWIAQSYKTSNKAVAVLPKEKLYGDTKVKDTDWYTPNVPNMEVGAFKASDFVVSKGSDIKIYSSGAYQKQVVMWDNKGDITNLNPVTRSFTQFKTTDGKVFSWDYAMCLYATSNGDVWFGTNSGVVSFNPAEAFSGDLRVNHMKVLSEDGASEEYLLDGIQVNCIVEDSLGRKLLGTRSNGFYIVNADGSKILGHFDTSNSPLPDNCIYNIGYSPVTNSAMVVTMNGVIEYFLDVTPSASDYSNVSIFPNPVLPSYTGFVTVSNLMNNSSVQIVAPDGTVVKETTCNGGTMTWDCCDATGERVAPGAYTVNAGTQPGNLAPVAKFVILK
ncbi:MAG: hypothetical protein MJZ74_08345 [Muribaculaceae bacterium]|nr:hypothetical protein [Muribaculaceae bacterium]